MPRHLVTILLGLALFVAPRDVHACSCMASGPPCQDFYKVAAVFIGTVRTITVQPRVPEDMDNVRVELEDVIAVRGVDAPAQTVMTSVADGGSCGYAFKPGERYVVYAYRAKGGGPLRTSICSRTRPIAEAADDLRFFELLSAGVTRSRVFGTITHTEPGTMRRDPQHHGAVANVRVSLRNEGGSYETATDAAGVYEFADLPPATYQLTIEPPPEFATDDRPYQSITLTDISACAENDFSLRLNGRVRGSIRSSTGGPAANVRVQMMLVEYVDSRNLVETIDATTDASGRFEFGPIAAGRYVLGVDLFRQPELLPDPTVAFPATYHPGTADPSAATMIEMRGGELHNLAPMTLPAALRTHRLTGAVSFADGTPAAGATVMLEDAVKPWRDAAAPIDVDASGAFSFVVHEGVSYIVSAYYRPRNTRGVRPNVTSVGPFTVTKQPEPLHLVVTQAP